MSTRDKRIAVKSIRDSKVILTPDPSITSIIVRTIAFDYLLVFDAFRVWPFHPIATTIALSCFSSRYFPRSFPNPSSPLWRSTREVRSLIREIEYLWSYNGRSLEKRTDKKESNRERGCILRLTLCPRCKDDIIEDNINQECFVTLCAFESVRCLTQ